MLAEDFFRARAEVAMMTQNRREFVRIFAGDLCDGAKEQGEADGQDAFFAAREDSATDAFDYVPPRVAASPHPRVVFPLRVRCVHPGAISVRAGVS